METLVLEDNHINLPKRILKKFKGKEIEMVETSEGKVLGDRPVSLRLIF